MAELSEVAFENILRSKMYKVLLALLNNAGHIIEIRCSENIQFSGGGELTEQEIESFLDLSDDASIIIKLSDLQIGDNLVPAVLLRVMKYGNQFDIDFNFSEQDIKSMIISVIIKKIYEFASGIGKSYEIEQWFGGMEPASDEDTRYFTDDTLGPLI